MLALLVWPLGAIVNRVVGPNNTEITHGSAVGGFQVFLRGKDLGTGFNPPTILIGTSGLSTCSVHPTSHGGVTRLKGFTSSSTMMKYATAPAQPPHGPSPSIDPSRSRSRSRDPSRCRSARLSPCLRRRRCIVDAINLPPPPDEYDAEGSFIMLPLYVVKDGRHADCWHVGGTNHGCFLRFDLGGTPRLTGVSTPMVQPGGLLRLTGHGIDGGLKGVAMVEGRLQQDASGTILGCFSRDEDQNGDTAVALSHSDDTSFSCWLEPPGAVRPSGLLPAFCDLSMAHVTHAFLFEAHLT